MFHPTYLAITGVLFLITLGVLSSLAWFLYILELIDGKFGISLIALAIWLSSSLAIVAAMGQLGVIIVLAVLVPASLYAVSERA